MSTTRQDQQLLSRLNAEDWLDTAMTFIGQEFSPEDVFSKAQLAAWAQENGWVRE